MAIYVKFAEEKKPKTVLKFLELFYSRIINTYGANSHLTFANKECTKIQDDNYWRSFDDILELVKTYYPTIKPVKLMHYLLILKIKLPNGLFSKPNLGACSGMGKIRYIPYHFHSYDYINVKMLNSKYTWNELLKPLNIHNIEDFKEYIK